MRQRRLFTVAFLVVLPVAHACSALSDRSNEGGEVASAASTATGNGGSGGSMAAGSASKGTGGDTNFSVASSGGSGGSTSGCSQTLQARIRDFQAAHPDFESFLGASAVTGLVTDTLGMDQKPVHAASGPTSQTSGPENFAQWYNDVPGVNQGFDIELKLVETSPGSFVYESNAFFPIDGQGFGNQGNPHNFHFTTEIHTRFDYQGGESFTFSGDDDLWLFINNRLAIDLGGLHPPLSATISLDAVSSQLGITVGGNYPMDIFHAERHTTESNFRLETSIACFAPPPT